jgi:hypothetical protein
MKSNWIASALFAAAGLASLNALAAGADGSVDVQPSGASTLTRAEVRAAALNAPHGPVTDSSMVDGGTVFTAAPSTGPLTRAQVRAEAVQAAANAQAHSDTAPGRA